MSDIWGQFKVEINTPTLGWLDVTGPSVSLMCSRQAAQPSTLSADVLDATLDPTQTDEVRMGKGARLSVRNAAGTAWQRIYTGTLNDVAVTRSPLVKAPSKRVRVGLSAVDALSTLANTPERRGVGSIDDLRWLVTGVPFVINGATTATAEGTTIAGNDNASLWDQVLIARDTALGYAWIDTQNRLQVWDAATIDDTPAATIGPDRYTSLDTDFALEQVVNSVTINFRRFNIGTETSTDVPYGPYEDAASIAQWGRRSAEFTIQAAVEDEAAIADYAAAILARTATATLRPRSARIPVNGFSDLDVVRDVDLCSVVTVVLHDGVTELPARVVGIDHEVGTAGWVTTLTFASADSTATSLSTPSTGISSVPAGTIGTPELADDVVLVLDSADGKSRNYYADEPPVDDGTFRDGFTWFDTNDDNKIHRWVTGVGWVATLLDTNAIADAAIVTAKIEDAAVLTAKLGNLAVDSSKLADAAVATAKIAPAAVITDRIANLAITSSKVADAAIGTAKIDNLAVTSALIANAAVGNAQIANLAVTNAKIADATILSAKIGDAQITTAKIADLAVNTAKIGNLAVGTGQIADLAVIGAKIADAAIVTAKIGDGQITNAKIGDAEIQSAKIANLDAAKVTTGTLAAARIGAQSITVDKLAVGDQTNFVRDPQMNNLSTWAVIAGSPNPSAATTAGVDGGNDTVMRFTADGANAQDMREPTFPVLPGSEFMVAGYARRQSTAATAGSLTFNLYWSDASGASLGSTAAVTITASTMVGGAWTRYTGTATVPAGAATARVGVRITSTVTAGGVYDVDRLEVRRKSTGELIVNGAINGQTVLGATVIAGASASSGERLIMRQDGSGGIIEAYTGAAGELSPGSINPGLFGTLPTVDINSPTSTGFTTAGQVRVYAGGVQVGNQLDVNGPITQYNSSTGVFKFQVDNNGKITSQGSYGDTTTAAANAFWASDAHLARSTSLRKYKLKRKPLAREDCLALLECTPRSWFDRAQVKANDGKTDGLKRIPGLVAEDVEKHAPLFATYDNDGLSGVAYDRVGAALIPLVRELLDRVAVLETS